MNIQKNQTLAEQRASAKAEQIISLAKALKVEMRPVQSIRDGFIENLIQYKDVEVYPVVEEERSVAGTSEDFIGEDVTQLPKKSFNDVMAVEPEESND